jgi:hypothetical protein
MRKNTIKILYGTWKIEHSDIFVKGKHQLTITSKLGKKNRQVFPEE